MIELNDQLEHRQKQVYTSVSRVMVAFDSGNFWASMDKVIIN